MTYLITFACYGCHLRGHEAGSVDRRHNQYGSPLLEPDPKFQNRDQGRMVQHAYRMDARTRAAVLSALLDRCAERQWPLLAAHVRSNHLHAVVTSEHRPERVMNDLKAFLSRRLNALGADKTGEKRWARHGSTRWLWKPKDVASAVRYVVDQQGEPMAVFEALDRC